MDKFAEYASTVSEGDVVPRAIFVAAPRRTHLVFESLQTCILRDFSACTPVFYAMRERARAQRARAKREQSCAVGNFAIFRDFCDFRDFFAIFSRFFRDFSLALALRSRSLRSRSLAHRASRKIQVCKMTKIAKIQVRRH